LRLARLGLPLTCGSVREGSDSNLPFVTEAKAPNGHDVGWTGPWVWESRGTEAESSKQRMPRTRREVVATWRASTSRPGVLLATAIEISHSV
jgi:hypothetical protein